MGCGSSSAASSTANPMPSQPTPSQPTPSQPTPLQPKSSKRKIDLTPEMIASMSEEEIMAMEMGNLNFFKKVNSVDTSRDYTIIVDASGSMFPSRWNQAKKALEYLAPAACKCDPDGITLFFFSNGFNEINNVKTSEDVMKHFNNTKNQIRGSTDLGKVLNAALKPDSVPRKKPETILVITDGEPDDRDHVEKAIILATDKYMQCDNDLSVTIVQVGDDQSAMKWLQELDDGLTKKGAKFDIVDILTAEELAKHDFAAIVAKSISD